MGFMYRDLYLCKIVKKGYDAFMKGESLESNPHPTDPDCSHKWQMGWHQAEWEVCYDCDRDTEE